MSAGHIAAVLITGSRGFIGRHLVKRLKKDGHDVHEFSASLGDDVLKPGSLARFESAGLKTVHHLAAESFVPRSWEVPGQFYAVNVLGTQNVLEFCRKTGARLVFYSTYIYGAPERLPVDEDHPVRPANPYAHSKWLAEDLCRFYARVFGITVRILRPFNIFGSGQGREFLIPQMLAELKEDGRITVQDLKPRRDFLTLTDFLDACLIAAAEDGKGVLTTNIGSGKSYSVAEIIDGIREIWGRPFEVKEAGEARPGEIQDVVASCRLTRMGLWRPNIALRDGLAELMRTG